MLQEVLLLKMAAEISLKSDFVRKQFENQLIQNIRISFKNQGLKIEKLQKKRGKILIQTFNKKKAITVLKKIFGIHSIALAKECFVESLEDVCENVLFFAKSFLKKNDSFALRVNRLGKHDFSSHDIAVRCGNKIMQAIPFLSVNLSNPKKEIFIELDEKQLLIFTKKIPGAKGLPIGTQGKIGVLFEGKKEEFLTAWLMLKRGAKVFPIIFKENVVVKKHLKKLRDWNNFEPLNSFKTKSLKNFSISVDAIASSENQLNEKTLKKIKALQKENNYLFLYPLMLSPQNIKMGW